MGRSAANRSSVNAQDVDDRVAFQEGKQDEFTAEVERLVRRKGTAFVSANQTMPGVACEFFFLEPFRP